jgi:hypothetical protein
MDKGLGENPTLGLRPGNVWPGCPYKSTDARGPRFEAAEAVGYAWQPGHADLAPIPFNEA